MPNLQLDCVNIVELTASEAETLKRQVVRASAVRLGSMLIEERDVIPDARSSDVLWEAGTITLELRYETKWGGQ